MDKAVREKGQNLQPPPCPGGSLAEISSCGVPRFPPYWETEWCTSTPKQLKTSHPEGSPQEPVGWRVQPPCSARVKYKSSPTWKPHKSETRVCHRLGVLCIPSTSTRAELGSHTVEILVGHSRLHASTVHVFKISLWLITWLMCLQPIRACRSSLCWKARKDCSPESTPLIWCLNDIPERSLVVNPAQGKERNPHHPPI